LKKFQKKGSVSSRLDRATNRRGRFAKTLIPFGVCNGIDELPASISRSKRTCSRMHERTRKMQTRRCQQRVINATRLERERPSKSRWILPIC